MCKRTPTSCLNVTAFVGLVLVCVLGVVSFFAPFWVGFSEPWQRRAMMGMRLQLDPKYDAWSGLVGSCDTDRNCARVTLSMFDGKGWYKASQAIFGIGVSLLIIAFVLQCVYTCCRCCSKASCLTTFIASLVIAGSLSCGLALGLYGGFSLHDGILKPLSVGGSGGTLDWAFFVGIAGACTGVIVSVMFYVDGCRQSRQYGAYSAPKVTRA